MRGSTSIRRAILFCFWSLSVNGRNIPQNARPVTREVVADTKYDFIIAGGGISGLTVADRLTEDPNGEHRNERVGGQSTNALGAVNVLVIEAGPFDKGEDSVLVPGAFNPAPYLWLPLNSVPQAALNNQTFNVPIGRVVGGGSVVNGMVFLRAGKEEYSGWDKLGAKGWDWDALLPYFIKVDRTCSILRLNIMLTII
jgi:choline dehydrogenase